jgi:hypothetical protein
MTKTGLCLFEVNELDKSKTGYDYLVIFDCGDFISDFIRDELLKKNNGKPVKAIIDLALLHGNTCRYMECNCEVDEKGKAVGNFTFITNESSVPPDAFFMASVYFMNNPAIVDDSIIPSYLKERLKKNGSF